MANSLEPTLAGPPASHSAAGGPTGSGAGPRATANAIQLTRRCRRASPPCSAPGTLLPATRHSAALLHPPFASSTWSGA